MNIDNLGPVDLFKFINEAYDLSMACLDPIVQKGILNLINKYAFNLWQNDIYVSEGIQNHSA